MSNNHPTPEPFLAREHMAAHLLQISDRAMWALGASGAIPYVKIGRSKRYDIDDLRAYINTQKSGGEQEQFNDAKSRQEKGRKTLARLAAKGLEGEAQ